MIEKAPRYIVLEDACQRYNLERDHLTRAVERGIVRAIRVNGHIAVAEEDVRKLRDANGEPVTDLPRYIPLSEAAERYGVSEEVLKRAIESGTIRAVQLDQEVAVAEGDVEKIVIRKSDFEHLRGKPISITEAAEKYGIPHGTFSRWVKAGHISVIKRIGRKVLLDEADVAYRAEIYKRMGGGRGRRIFDADGKPYKIKYPERTRHPTPLIEVVS